MEKRQLRIVAGHISGIVLDVISGVVDGLVAGTTYLATINGNQSQSYSQFFGEGNKTFDFEPLLIQIRVTAAVGVISVPAISIGTNSPNYNNVLSTVSLSGLTAVETHTIMFPSSGSSDALYGQDIYVNVTNVGVGTTLTLAVDIIGSYQP